MGQVLSPWPTTRVIADRIEGEVAPSSWIGKEPPPREWMVADYFVKGSVGMISGDGSIGKSLLTQQLATCAATGKRWLDLRVEPGRVIYLGCEDMADELHRRQHDINRHYGVGMDDVLENTIYISRVGQLSPLIEFEKFTRKPVPTELFNKLQNRADNFGATYVIIDTATMTFSGNQNVETDVSAFITMLRRLAIRRQGVVILTKHPSNSGRALGTGESGNVAWQNSVRARIYMTTDKDKRLHLQHMKANYSKKADNVYLKYQDGAFVRDYTEVNTGGWNGYD